MPARAEVMKVNFQFSVELNKPINNLHPECIQSAIERLITENPYAFMGNSPEEILRNVWVSKQNQTTRMENTSLGRQSQLPTVTEEQRKEMSLALQELGDDDGKWTNDIISARKTICPQFL